MAEFAMCARDSMYGPSTPVDPAPMTASKAQDTGAVAAQQGGSPDKTPKRKNRKSKKPHFTPFDYTATEDSPAATPVNRQTSGAAQQAESATQVPGSKPRADAGSRSTAQTTSPAKAQPSPTRSAHDNPKQGRRRGSRRNSKRKSTSSAASDTMGGPVASMYIPPHLRKHNMTRTSTGDKADAKPGDCVAEQRPVSCTADGAGKYTKDNQSQALTISQVRVPPSPPTSVEQKPEIGKCQDNGQTPQRDESPTVVEQKVQIIISQNDGPTFQDVPTIVIPAVKEKKNVKVDPHELYNEMSAAGKIDEWAFYEKTGEIIRKPEDNTLPGGNPRWSRHPKKHVWPKARDMKPLPSDGQSEGGVDVKSDSEGDPFYDVRKIIDWNGELLPPPESWAERVRFTNRHPGLDIIRWLMALPDSCVQYIETNKTAFTSGPFDVAAAIPNREVVPRNWIPDKVEGEPIRVFMDKLPHRAPLALSDVGAADAIAPFWNRYDEGLDSYFMQVLTVPEANIDKNDHENELERPFALKSTTVTLREMKDREDLRQRQRQSKMNRPAPRPVALPVPLDRSIHPKVNMYLRPIQPADVRGIMDIYNYYVGTINTTEFDPCSEAEIRDRCNEVINAKLPFFVAVAKSNRPKSRTGYISEKIIGYIYLQDHVDASSMHRHTFELDMFVHPGYLRQGIGKCLLDKMMAYTDSCYPPCGGYEYINEFNYLKTGEKRIVKTILVSYHYEHETKVNWMIEYLRPFGFVRAGNLQEIGYKNGRIVNKVLFQYQTTEKINASVRPDVSRGG